MRDWFILKLERQFIFFICLLLTLHFWFTFLAWPDKFAWLLMIPVIFSLFNLLTFILKGFQQSIWEIKYLLIVFLYLMISLKLGFRYYNILLCILLVVISVYVLRYKKFKIVNLQYRLTLLIIINFTLILIPDISIFRYIYLTDNQVWKNKLKWDDFQDSEPYNVGKMAASINTDIYWKSNRVYNFPRFISIAAMEKTSSWVRPEYSDYEGNLLRHEQLHLDITEWTRREFQDSLYTLVAANDQMVYYVYGYFREVESKRQFEYDSISKHGIDFIGQIQWNKKVRLKLN